MAKRLGLYLNFSVRGGEAERRRRPGTDAFDAEDRPGGC